MRFEFPQALLLALPLALLLWRTARLPGPPMWLRVALIGTLVLALARPEIVRRTEGSDLLVVVDRSQSMPGGSEARAKELIELASREARPGDRVGVVAFGREARVELAPTARAKLGAFQQAIDPDASDLAAALERSLELAPADRAVRVLVVSDGRATGVDPAGAARRLAARGIAIDYRWLGREDAPRDLAVTSLDLPASVAEREPFLLTASVHATEAGTGTVILRRNGQPLVRGPYAFRAGTNLLTFRDLVEAPGVAAYELTVEAEGDGVVENDVGRSVLRIEGPPRVLLMTGAAGGVLEKTLRDAGLNLEVRSPGALTQVDLDGVGAVVLENVEAGALGEAGLTVLAQYVRDAGGGLVMTGGRRSFGEGGYRKSPIEDVLPVSLEMRQEQRKASVALSILMDCSCSMGATVPDGRTKMQLAAEGAVAALELLNLEDEASVHMIDTSAHEIFGLSPVHDGLPLDKVARGFSGGGGIYVGEALRVGKREILDSRKPTRHVLLFSDATDTEAPEDYRETLARLRNENVTVSVIGMGTPADVDAKLLEEIAALGNGRLYFAEDPVSLPRIFSQETIAVARATFVDTPVALLPGADLPLLGRVSPTALPQVGGYNLTWLRPRASVALRSGDDNAAPLVALWPHGAGRVVAFTTEADGEYTGTLRSWDGYRALLEQMVRWTMPTKSPGEADFVARAVRRGSDLHLTLDFPPDAAPTDAEPSALVLSGDGKGAPIEVPLRWEAEDRLGAHVTLPGTGTFHPVIRVGGRALRAPPVTLPYAPEFEPGSAREGREVLVRLAESTGGQERLSMTGLFADAGRSQSRFALAPILVAFAVVLLLAEVFVRRFLAGRPQPFAGVTDAALKSVLETAQRRAMTSRSAPAAAPSATAPPTTQVVDQVSGLSEPAAPRPGVQTALEQARKRAQRRTGR